MNKRNNSYVEAIIKKAIPKNATANATAKLGRTKQYVNQLKKEYAVE